MLTLPNNLRYFILLCLFFMLISEALQYLLTDENMYIDHFTSQVSYERAVKLVASMKRHEWVGYMLIPLLFLIKLSFVASCLGIGLFLLDNQFQFGFFFRSAILAEFVFLLPILLKILWFLFVQTDYDLDDLSKFYPLSALNLVDIGAVSHYWIYPLQLLNLFEVAYWFLLAYGVADATGFSFKRSFGLVMSSYGVGLVLWVVLIMFLTITYS